MSGFEQKSAEYQRLTLPLATSAELAAHNQAH
jgi:hypothetical protein